MDAKAIVRVDAAFEAALGAVLVVGAAAGALGGGDFPSPVGAVVLVVVGAMLLAVATVLWRGRIGLAALAGANLATAVAAAVWCGAAAGFSTAGTAVVSAAAAGLTCLAAVQVATLRR